MGQRSGRIGRKIGRTDPLQATLDVRAGLLVHLEESDQRRDLGGAGHKREVCRRTGNSTSRRRATWATQDGRQVSATCVRCSSTILVRRDTVCASALSSFPWSFIISMMARGDLYAAQRHFVRGSLLVQRTQLAIPAHLRLCETGRTRRGRTCSRRRRVEQHQLLRRASGCCMGTGR